MKNIERKTIASNHGFERVVERTNCKRRDVESFVRKIWTNGKKLEDYGKKSPIHSYLINVQRSTSNDRAVRVSGNNLYIFNKMGTTLITCYEIPQKVLQDKRNSKQDYKRYNWEN